MTQRTANRISLALLISYLGLALWYTPLRGPLKPKEIDHYVSLMGENGLDAAGRDRLRTFLEKDTGGDFVMLNSIELRNLPLQVDGVEPGDDAEAVLGKYMEYMFPALLRRASHPMLIGTAAADAMDVWGVENGESWTQAVGMRYRSRRDLMEIATNPVFDDKHQFKTAAIEKTIAFPLEPWFHFGDPRLLGGLVLVILLLLLRVLGPQHPTSRHPRDS